MRRFITMAWGLGSTLILLAAASAAWAQTSPAEPAPLRWRPDSLFMAAVSTCLFGGIGIVLAILGFKLFDLLIPFKLEAEICEKQNMAVAVLSAAMILGICVVVAAAVL
jgi:hypothetical protein